MVFHGVCHSSLLLCQYNFSNCYLVCFSIILAFLGHGFPWFSMVFVILHCSSACTISQIVDIYFKYLSFLGHGFPWCLSFFIAPLPVKFLKLIFILFKYYLSFLGHGFPWFSMVFCGFLLLCFTDVKKGQNKF